nr:hypothetical protein [uncultured Oscillibacter sp.]
MSAEQLLYAMGDIRGTFIREAAPVAAAPRRRRRLWAAALAACLCLVLLIARTRPAAPMGTEPPAAGDTLPADRDALPGPGASGGEDLPAGCPLFPGEISQPLLYWQGTAYAWDRVGAPGRPAGEPPETIGQWTELSPLAGVTAEETSEDLWLYADIGPVSGTVYADPEDHPGVLYVLMTTEWFEEEWVRFVADERLLTPVFFYGGQLYYLDPCYPPRNAVSELPEGYEPAGMLVFPSDHDFDRLPDRDLVITLCPEYPGNTLYVHPDGNGILYVEYQKHWSGGCETLYVPATPTPQPW